MGNLPAGIVTFLFTDWEESTRAWEESPVLIAQALVQHDEAISNRVTDHNAIPVKARGEGDSRFIVFSSATDAITGAADIQRDVAKVDWSHPMDTARPCAWSSVNNRGPWHRN